MNKIYTGIGSRSTPEPILALMRHIGHEMAMDGWTLRSGGAVGADSAFAEGCGTKGMSEIYLPWFGFNDEGVPVDRLGNFDEAMDIAEQFHPAWHKCSSGAKKLHARNVYQILGIDLNTPTNLVICWTPNGKRTGGTGQALRLAEALDIKIFDLFFENSVKELETFVNSV